MKQAIYKVTSNKRIAENIYEMILEGNTTGILPGQFVNIKLDGFFLRRPISIADCEEGCLTLLVKVLGEGTQAMSEITEDSYLDLLTGLGNGFDLSKSTRKPLLVGGGIGCAPLFYLCKQLCSRGIEPAVILGFNHAGEIYYEEEFRRLTPQLTIVTADGSRGIRGFATDAMAAASYEYFYTCGPEPMLRAVANVAVTEGQYSLEERMGCGFGACMGCSCKTKYGSKRICKEGPVLESGEIIW